MKILIVKSSSLGDIVHAFPVLRYLREKFPKGQIDWIVEEKGFELLKSAPIDRVLKIRTKKWRTSFFHKKTRNEIREFKEELRKVKYDVVFDLQGNLKSGWVLFLTNAKHKVGFGWKTVPEWPNCLFTNVKFNRTQSGNIREDYLKIVQSYFSDFSNPSTDSAVSFIETNRSVNDSSSVLICPGANWENKRLSEETLLDFLLRMERVFAPSYLFTWGTEEEKKTAERLSAHFSKSSVLEKLPLSFLQKVMSQCSLVVAMDSLPLHLSETVNTPSIGFFGPSSPQKYAPLENHFSIQGKCPYGMQFSDRCSKLRTCKTGNCIKGLNGKFLFEEAKPFIEKALSATFDK